MFPRTLRLAGTLFVFVALISTSAFGQGALGVITGRVIDPSGVAVKGAAVVLTNTAMAQTKETATNGDGYYTFPALLPSGYKVRVTIRALKP